MPASVTRIVIISRLTGIHTFPPVFPKIPLYSPIPSLSIKPCLHTHPRKHNWRRSRIHIFSRIPWLIKVLDKVHREVSKIRQIQPVEPNHRPVAVLPVVVVVPCRGEDHVALLHLDTAPVHGCEAAVAFDYIPHCEGRVSVRWGCFVWHYELEAGVEGVGCVRGVCFGLVWLMEFMWHYNQETTGQKGLWYTSSGVNEHEDPSLGLFLGD